MIDLSKFETTQEIFEFLKKNKDELLQHKKHGIKHADAFSFVFKSPVKEGEGSTNKSEAETVETLLAKEEITVHAIINTTNVLDSHSDVHIDGLWKKTLSETKGLYLLEQHKHDFDGVISRDVKAKTEKMKWRDLGLDVDGETEALIFEAKIRKSDNQKMFEHYAKGNVLNHSVGMEYVRLELCVNSDDEYYKEEKASWDKYIDRIVNREAVEKKGYFYAVSEAKLKEGSAVLFGSNPITPTIETKTIQPSQDTVNRIPAPSQDTQKRRSMFEVVSIVLSEPAPSTLKQESLFEKIGKTVKN
ncbi:MAG: hypothetical protein LBS54_04145 [Dysgonamonadaceae bacterium]|jgi:hypothetical protein|nr:hypothetical protein [Dysgonamonadaceae bacterium]